MYIQSSNTTNNLYLDECILAIYSYGTNYAILVSNTNTSFFRIHQSYAISLKCTYNLVILPIMYICKNAYYRSMNTVPIMLYMSYTNVSYNLEYTNYAIS